MMAKQPKVKTDNWRELPIEKWNTRTYQAYLTHLTEEHFGVTYEPTGGGSKQMRYSRELGMIKNAQEKYGNHVVKRFIERCISEYHPKPEYPYVSFTFAYSYMSDRFPKVQAEVAEENRRKEKAEATDKQAQAFDAADYEDWL